jgi:hypothetical protein
MHSALSSLLQTPAGGQVDSLRISKRLLQVIDHESRSLSQSQTMKETTIYPLRPLPACSSEGPVQMIVASYGSLQTKV